MPLTKASEVTEIVGLGKVTEIPDLGWHQSDPIKIPILGGKECRIAVESYVNDPSPSDFHLAILNFLSVGNDVLRDAETHIFRYYEDCYREFGRDDLSIPRLTTPNEVWRHIQFGGVALVSRRPCGDKEVYVSLESECDWEPEHGLELVFRNGAVVTKVGPFDGHLAHSDAFADDSLEGVVYPVISLI